MHHQCEVSFRDFILNPRQFFGSPLVENQYWDFNFLRYYSDTKTVLSPSVTAPVVWRVLSAFRVNPMVRDHFLTVSTAWVPPFRGLYVSQDGSPKPDRSVRLPARPASRNYLLVLRNVNNAKRLNMTAKPAVAQNWGHRWEKLLPLMIIKRMASIK